MSRLRVTLARSESDRVIATCLDKAERLILQAIDACPKEPTPGDPTGYRARSVKRELERILGSFHGVGRVSAPYDTTDVDLNPEAVSVRKEKPKPKAPVSIPVPEDTE